MTNISNNNNSNRYMHIHIYISQIKLILDLKHFLSSYHLCMTNISNSNNSNRYIYIYIYIYFTNRTHLIIIIYHLTTLCVHDILPFIFIFMFQFVFIFHITFMFHEHIYTCCIFYIFLVSCLLHMEFHILVKYDVYEITPHSCIIIPL